MSLPDNALFSRYAQINIGGHLFTSPPFSLEFGQDFKTGRLTQTKARLYNPSPDTIRTAEPKRVGSVRILTDVIIDAGYESDWGTAVMGKIHDYKVIKKSPDIILEMTIGDATSEWTNALITKTWRQTYALQILTEILADISIISTISLGVNKYYRTFTATTFRGAVQKIAIDTDSEYYFRNGVFNIQPKSPPRTQTVLFLSPESGLLNKIEKITRGFKFNTLYFYKLMPGDIVQIQDKNTPVSTVRIVKGTKQFSSFGKSECEFEATEI